MHITSLPAGMKAVTLAASRDRSKHWKYIAELPLTSGSQVILHTMTMMENVIWFWILVRSGDLGLYCCASCYTCSHCTLAKYYSFPFLNRKCLVFATFSHPTAGSHPTCFRFTIVQCSRLLIILWLQTIWALMAWFIALLGFLSNAWRFVFCCCTPVTSWSCIHAVYHLCVMYVYMCRVWAWHHYPCLTKHWDL